MSDAIIAKVEAAHKKPEVPQVDVGDNVDVHTRIVEGEKERIQVFSGVVISHKGRGIHESITVRRIVANEGVERTFPLHSPKVAKVEVTRHGHARRAKLYYLRDRIGKSRRLRDRRRGLGHFETEAAPAAAPPAPVNETTQAAGAGGSP